MRAPIDEPASLSVAKAPAASAPFLLAPRARAVGWISRRFELPDDDTLVAVFDHLEARASLEIVIVPRAKARPGARPLRHCAVRYRASVAGLEPSQREAARALVLAMGELVDQRLHRAPGATIAQALGREPGARKVTFGRELLRGLLAPEIEPGAELAGGYALHDVYPSSQIRDAKSSLLQLVLDFRRERDGRRMLIVVGRREDAGGAFARSAHFALAQLTLGAAEQEGEAEVRALVSFLLQLRDHEGLDVAFPDVADDVATALLVQRTEAAEGDDDGRELNLAIGTDCGQACCFCSVKEIRPPEPSDSRLYARLAADLAEHRARGVRRVRVNGYDPLSFDRILELVEHATALGYQHAEILSPCTRLAERSFCEALVAAMPASKRFSLPLYAADAETHDAVVGAPGAFAAVLRALDTLTELVGGGAIVAVCVVTRTNLLALPALVDWCATRGLGLEVHLAFPSYEGRGDRWYAVAARFDEIAAVAAEVLAAGRGLYVSGLPACALFRATEARGVPARDWIVPAARVWDAATAYRSERYQHRSSESGGTDRRIAATAPCPRASECALSTACTREVLRAYVEKFGIDELRPVSLVELLQVRAAG